MKLSIHHFQSLPSTQESAKAFLLEGHTEGTVIIADSQTHGRGQMERSWLSPEGNLYASIILSPMEHPSAPPVSAYGQLAILAGVALREGLKEAFPNSEEINLKWPNDGIVNDLKLFGVLVEVWQEHVILGIGVNVNTVPELVEKSATSLLKILSPETKITVESLVPFLLKAVFKYYKLWLKGEFESIRLAFEHHAYQLGQKINRKSHTGDTIEGIFKGLSQEGAMILEDPLSNSTRLVYSAF